MDKVIVYYDNINNCDSIKTISTLLNNKLHSFNSEPAHIFYSETGVVLYVEYWNNGVLHRPAYEGAAQILYYLSGVKQVEKFYSNGILYRTIMYDSYGNITQTIANKTYTKAFIKGRK